MQTTDYVSIRKRKWTLLHYNRVCVCVSIYIYRGMMGKKMETTVPFESLESYTGWVGEW